MKVIIYQHNQIHKYAEDLGKLCDQNKNLTIILRVV